MEQYEDYLVAQALIKIAMAVSLVAVFLWWAA